MGGAKSLWLEEQKRGWYSFDDKFACADCFEDPDIQEFIRDNATEPICSYCGTRSSADAIATDMNEVMELIMEGLHQEWGDPNGEGVSWESAEGGWQGEVLDGHDLFQTIDFGTANEDLYWDIQRSMQDRQWCQRDFYRLLPQRELISDWEYFSKLVMHETRFVFYKLPGDTDRHYGGERAVAPHEILDTLARLVIDMNLLVTMPVGTEWFHARVHDENMVISTIEELGPPPPAQARFSNRMSPAGIPMFYGSSDRTTAIKEITQSLRYPAALTVASFVATKEMRLLDLTKVPAVPGLFDRSNRNVRVACIFLNAFVTDLTKPIAKDGREHIEYVPSQIVTEYFRRVFLDSERRPIHGIAFPSAVSTSGQSCVLFLGPVSESKLFVDEHAVDQWLDLAKVEREVLQRS